MNATARWAAADVRETSRALAAEAQRLASGDLSPGPLPEPDDELGEVARAFGGLGRLLREALEPLVAAGREIERTRLELGAPVDGSHAGDAEIGRVATTMERVKAEVSGIADSAHALSMSVEESSSSVLELGVTGEELNQNATALNERVSEVSSSIEEMMQSARHVLANVEELAAASGETSSSMEEMASSLLEVDTNAAETARLSHSVIELADTGRSKVEQTIHGMNAIQDATDAARTVIHGLGARTGEIGKILNVIEDVADETNLLALNAAIIAAQSGEHGRAFSVVADEIKDLADKVIASTKEIGEVIHAVQDEANNAVGAIESGARSVGSGVNLSAEAGVALENITNASREAGDRIGEIVNAVREQSKAAAHVVGLMDKVRDGAEQIRTASNEQVRGNELVLRNASAMNEVAMQVSNATEEQAGGAHRMRDAIESVRTAVEKINRSLQEQSSACQEMAELLAQAHEKRGSDQQSAARTRDAMRRLLGQAEGLQQGLRRFQVSGGSHP